jgi:glycerate kinase
MKVVIAPDSFKDSLSALKVVKPLPKDGKRFFLMQNDFMPNGRWW